MALNWLVFAAELVWFLCGQIQLPQSASGPAAKQAAGEDRGQTSAKTGAPAPPFRRGPTSHLQAHLSALLSFVSYLNTLLTCVPAFFLPLG